MKRQSQGFVRKLGRSGNSRVLVITRDMREHLGVDDEVQVILRENEVVLRRPEGGADDPDFLAASQRTGEKFKTAYKKLAE
jgi:predicted RND superfamily exporter protein